MSLILKPMPDIYRNMRSSSAANESISVQLSGVATSMVCARQQQVFSSVPGSFFKKIAQPRLMRVERLRDGCGDTIQLLRQLQALILLLEQVAAEFSVYTLIVSCICYSIYIIV